MTPFSLQAVEKPLLETRRVSEGRIPTESADANPSLTLRVPFFNGLLPLVADESACLRNLTN